MVDRVITCLCLISLLSNASFSLIAPFYPLEVKEKGIDVIYIGFLMGTQALTFIFSSLITGLYLQKIGRTRGMILGVLLIIVSILGLGSLKYVLDQRAFVLYSFLWKFLGGLGSGINSTSSMAIVATHYKEEREKAIGLIEASSGIGLLLGPFFGALLYEIGGYILPFAGTALTYFLIYPLIAYTLATISEAEAKLTSQPQVVKEKSVKASQLIKVPRFAFGLISQILIYGTITSLQPTLALHLETFGYTAVFIGFSFAIPTLIYAATSPLIYILTSRFSKGAVILLGYLLTSSGMFLVGTSKLLGMYNSPAFIILGLAIMGFGAGMIIIPVLPDMIESLEEHSNLSAAQHDQLHNTISGLFIACQGIGETLGPVFGSTSENIYGFRLTQDIVAVTLMIFMVLYFVLCGGFSIFAAREVSKSQVTSQKVGDQRQKDQMSGLVEIEMADKKRSEPTWDEESKKIEKTTSLNLPPMNDGALKYVEFKDDQ